MEEIQSHPHLWGQWLFYRNRNSCSDKNELLVLFCFYSLSEPPHHGRAACNLPRAPVYSISLGLEKRGQRNQG